MTAHSKLPAGGKPAPAIAEVVAPSAILAHVAGGEHRESAYAESGAASGRVGGGDDR
ncbi:hypothetical protein [Kribbella sp. NPDC051770]|uniref:hypothetical protein n=1 Tax=Kribbella sp. NPDC051770 TaxID=3155413 RepID=UPI0034210A46